MAKEIERKFLVRDGAWRPAVESSILIVQFYLAISAERSIRLRISDGGKAKLTLKFGSDLAERDEFEYPVPLDEAREMIRFAVGAVIRKTRHHVRHNGYVYEIDSSTSLSRVSSSPNWRRPTVCRRRCCRPGSAARSPARSVIPTPRWR